MGRYAKEIGGFAQELGDLSQKMSGSEKPSRLVREHFHPH
jgi:hypothetical protein